MRIATLAGESMGTTWRVQAMVPKTRDLRPLHSGIERVLTGVVEEMSTWEADAFITRFNRAESGSRHTMPSAFAQVMNAALDVARVSGGAFDPTMGALVGLWGFGAHACLPHETGDETVVRALKAEAGWTRIEIVDGQLLQPGGLKLDFSGVAKGFAADEAAQRLKDAGIASALVEVGGELFAFGTKPDGSPWRVMVEDAHPDAQAPRVLALNGHGVATSGDRYHQALHEGKHITHTLDPRTGAPMACLPMTVTVVAKTAMAADAWATAMRVLGEVEGMALADSEDIAVRFHRMRQGCAIETMNPAFAALLVH